MIAPICQQNVRLSMSDSSVHPGRQSNGRFASGNPGRRLGARNRVSHRAAMAILADFEAFKLPVLDRLRTNHAPAYFAILTRLLDKQLQVEASQFADYSDAEIARIFSRVRSVINEACNAREGLIELEEALSCVRRRTRPPGRRNGADRIYGDPRRPSAGRHRLALCSERSRRQVRAADAGAPVDAAAARRFVETAAPAKRRPCWRGMPWRRSDSRSRPDTS